MCFQISVVFAMQGRKRPEEYRRGGSSYSKYFDLHCDLFWNFQDMVEAVIIVMNIPELLLKDAAEADRLLIIDHELVRLQEDVNDLTLMTSVFPQRFLNRSIKTEINSDSKSTSSRRTGASRTPEGDQSSYSTDQKK